MKDTIKEIDSLGFGVRTHPREKLVAVQTPQIFKRFLLLDAFARAREEGFWATDETTLVERYGGKVHMVSGSYENIKITTPEDIFMAAAILKQRAAV
jgi:2-C-methyl-D-erythritol 4-phosphate cytidylyltransferase